MNANDLMKILEDTLYVRTSGSPEELQCAEYIRGKVAQMGLEAHLEPFAVPMAEILEAELTVDGVSYPCTGYLCAGDWDVEAPLYYLRDYDDFSLEQCRGKIVLSDSYVGYWKYQDLRQAGALGYITCNGTVYSEDRDIDLREQRLFVQKGHRMPAVNIHVTDAIAIVRAQGKTARIRLRQKEWTGESNNVVLEIPGQVEQYIAFTAHYDTTHLSVGPYDNMSGCAGLLYLAEYFAQNKPRHSLRFIWCGSEERGLLGAKAYCAEEDKIKNCIMNINLDMIGSLMGRFITCVTAGEDLRSYIAAMSAELGFQNDAYLGVYSSDSTPFADKDIPAVSFARISPRTMSGYHDRFDTLDCMSGEQMEQDFEFVLSFAKRMANAARCPFRREMPEDMRKKLDNYLGIKRQK